MAICFHSNMYYWRGSLIDIWKKIVSVFSIFRIKNTEKKCIKCQLAILFNNTCLNENIYVQKYINILPAACSPPGTVPGRCLAPPGPGSTARGSARLPIREQGMKHMVGGGQSESREWATWLTRANQSKERNCLSAVMCLTVIATWLLRVNHRKARDWIVINHVHYCDWPSPMMRTNHSKAHGFSRPPIMLQGISDVTN